MYSNLMYFLEVLLRLCLAFILGGIIGAERETENKNAGFRTHILVCLASALVMLTSEFIFKIYSDKVNLDPARLGAQVISGIGFLGAGAIIKEGINVKGLTTAATLWTVACVGLACGIGFYMGAIISTVLIFVALLLLKGLRDKFRNSNNISINIITKDIPGQIGAIGSVLGKYNINIGNIKIVQVEDDENILLVLNLMQVEEKSMLNVIGDLKMIEGVCSVEQS